MTNSSFNPEDRELVVVYPTRGQADRARQVLMDRGIPDTEIRVDDESDSVASLRAETSEDAADSWLVYPQKAARGLGMILGAGAVVAVVAAFPLALLPIGGSYWLRWLVFALVGVALWTAVALVVGPASSAPRPGARSAAERGTVVRVAHDTPDLRAALEGIGPLRVDEVNDAGNPIATLATDADDSFAETVREMEANIEHGDDYHPRTSDP